MRIAYVGHSHHRTTGSCRFLLDALRTLGTVEERWYEGWASGAPFDADGLAGGDFDAVVVWQVELAAERMAALRLPNVTFFPMYDGCHAMGDGWWRALSGLKVVSFSAALHAHLQPLGVRSRHVQYFPDPATLPRTTAGPGLAGYFWQRQQDITWRTVRALLGDARFERFTLHAAADPTYGEVVLPSPDEAARLGLRVTRWHASRAAAAADLLDHNVYFAPRLREGIGLAFLEAMGMGYLVVAPNRSTMNEYIVSGVNGLLYDPDHPSALDLSGFRRLGDRARRTIELGRARWERCLPALLDLVATPAAAVPVSAPFDALDPRGLGARTPARHRPTAGPDPLRPPLPCEGGRRPQTPAGAPPRVTVAVVTRNAQDVLEGTLQSIFSQDLPDLEVILLDGASTDGTLDVIRRHAGRLDLWRSAPDGGPYQAMNAAADLAHGRYVLFMNAGDRFHTADALSLALDGAPADAGVIYGHHVYRDMAGHEALHPAADFDETWARLRAGDIGWGWLSGVPGHQATLTRTDLLRAHGYRADLRIAADHELLYRLAGAGVRFHHAGAILATYVAGGLSWTNRRRCLEEWRRIALEHSGAHDRAAAALAGMRRDMLQAELPHLDLWEVIAHLGRVRGATRELKRRVRERLQRISANRAPSLQIRFDAPYPEGVRSMHGLSAPEEWGRWTDGERAVIELTAPWQAPARLALDIREVFGPNVGKPLLLRIGARTHLHLLRRGPQRIRLQLPADEAGLRRIELEIPAPESPLAFRCGTDPRRLGVALSALELKAPRER
jgi:hypothetical protein